jgi:hypothetical protein
MGQGLGTATQLLFITKLYTYSEAKLTELTVQTKFMHFQLKIINGHLCKQKHKISKTQHYKFQNQLTLIKLSSLEMR